MSLSSTDSFDFNSNLFTFAQSCPMNFYTIQLYAIGSFFICVIMIMTCSIISTLLNIICLSFILLAALKNSKFTFINDKTYLVILVFMVQVKICTFEIFKSHDLYF